MLRVKMKGGWMLRLVKTVRSVLGFGCGVGSRVEVWAVTYLLDLVID